MKNHYLEINPESYEALVSGVKKFEIRMNDRNYKVGDKLILKEFDGEKLTGRWTERVVTYMTDYEQKEGYVVMSLMWPY